MLVAGFFPSPCSEERPIFYILSPTEQFARTVGRDFNDPLQTITVLFSYGQTGMELRFPGPRASPGKVKCQRAFESGNVSCFWECSTRGLRTPPLGFPPELSVRISWQQQGHSSSAGGFDYRFVYMASIKIMRLSLMGTKLA